MNKEFYKNNRSKVLESIDDNSLLILFAGKAPKKTADEKYPFTPNRNFYYLTGIDEENHILVLSKINGKTNEYLFIKEVDTIAEKWEGKTIRKEEVSQICMIEDVKYLGEFNNFIEKVVLNKEEINIYLDLETGNTAYKYVNEIKHKYYNINIKNAFKIIGNLRLIKTDEEVSRIRKAIDITIEGVKELMRNSKSEIKEYELEAYFDFICKKNGVKDFAFKTIAAAGKNATVLHYVTNDSELKDGDLILFDLGAQYKYYNGDISRTFPINGKFTERQKEVYNAVLRVNEKVIKEMKPGVKFVDLNKKAKDWISEECISLGLMTEKDDVSKFYYHSIGHSLGMDTHDIELENRDVTFEPGMIYTVEPGIYIENEGIGIRIEDDVLITEDGNEVLTKEMIKTVEEIEAFMADK
ncbi:MULTISPECIES: aminopeptidase P family protein [Clostridium]|jgi:Xaa-Pro aminopeptidase|uniref:Xaa-Pro aminopeptidase n=1 Tax=Clostridium tertium TaxID=1559 RepID=A0A9X4B1P3_9CLOT|nr:MULTISPECIES: aminopeptidase P family protein [Clostridium]MDB1941176.1 aminopeptidase P family protein [Clostridium tertium]MDC4239333.1 aminopeptidase P family protein [Clostridium tertium]MDI9217574.1 aminopeptidase P family protein [Clostridium tertium]MDU2681741.1 aminopeptidase P family protein [Clostridium sp.]MDU8965541.1 aminopeptidase P family protein [Clostridium sp.]